MAKSKYSEVEMIGALKQREAGRSAAEVGRELGVSKHTVYGWKAKYGGMTVGEAQLRQLEDDPLRRAREQITPPHAEGTALLAL